MEDEYDRLNFADLFDVDDDFDDPDYDPGAGEDLLTSGSDDPEPEKESGEPISRARTRRYLENVTSQELRHRCLELLDEMAKRNIDLPIFLDVISWGDDDSTANDRFRYARNSLFTSVQFASILDRWADPPGENTGDGVIRKRVIREFVLKLVGKWVVKEMKKIRARLTPPADSLSKEHLTSVNLGDLAEYLASDKGCPILTHVLLKAGWSERQAKHNTLKTPKNVRCINHNDICISYYSNQIDVFRSL